MKLTLQTTSVTNKVRCFTFLEMLVVIIIIGIITAVSTPQFRKTFDNLALENFVKDIYYLIRYLQASAIQEAGVYYLNINKDKAEFRGLYKEGAEFKTPEGRLGKVYKAPAGVTISLEPPEKTGVYFFPDGSIEKVTIILENLHKKQFSLVARGLSSGIEVK